MNVTDEVKRILAKQYNEVKPRDMLVREYLNETIEIDPRKCLLDFESRPFNYKYFYGELLWYLFGDLTTKFISKFSKFWVNLEDEYGLINSNYGNILQSSNQLKFAYDKLANDKFTRQAFMFINGTQYQKDTKDFPCTLTISFYIRDDKLNMKVHMRSQDIFYGLTYDIPWYSYIMQTMYMMLKPIYPNLELGTYIHHMDNVHYYERHFDLVDKIKNENVTNYKTMEISNLIFDNTFTLSDNRLKDLYTFYNGNPLTNIVNDVNNIL